MPAGYLLDTNVVSALDPSRNILTAKAVAWLARREASNFVSVITLIEIEAGICALRLQNATAKAERLAVWFEGLQLRLTGSILPVDETVSRTAGRLIAETRAAGLRIDTADLLIGATAKARDLVLVTRNVRHFETFGVEVIDPFSI